MELSNPGAKYNMTNGVPTCTRQGVVIFGGHSGMGMLQAAELSRNKLVDHVMTVSKRGKPTAPGPSSAFIEAISQNALHYMAACDENDQQAVECLLDWAPPVTPLQVPPEELNAGTGFEDLIASTQADMDSMSPALLTVALEAMKELKTRINYSQREVKARLQHKSFSKDKEQLQEQELQLQEQEAQVMELMAELTGRIGAKSQAPALAAPAEAPAEE